MALELITSREVAAPIGPRIFLCIFGYGGMEHYTVEGALREMLLMAKENTAFALHMVHGDALISRSRSKAFSVFMESGNFDVCVMLDHDIQWQPGALLGLAKKAHERQALTAGIYACRGFGRGCASRLNQEASKFTPGEDKLLEAEYLATGFWACPRTVGEEILKNGTERVELFQSHDKFSPVVANWKITECVYNDGTFFYDYFRPIAVPSTLPATPHEYASEDWAFSWRARQANPNRPLYAWTLPHLVHHGSYGFTMKTAYLRE